MWNKINSLVNLDPEVDKIISDIHFATDKATSFHTEITLWPPTQSDKSY